MTNPGTDKLASERVWDPNDEQFWNSTAKPIAWRTLWITTYCLLLSFATWFMVSAIVVKLSGIGFQFTKQQLFWLNAMPGLAAGLLRLVHTFLIPVLGTRLTISISTLLLVVPCLGWGFAVTNQSTSYSTFLMLGFLAGLGGGNFSSFMPSTSLFFPKKLQGTALGIQAGIGNFGVSVVQFLAPIIIGVSLMGSNQIFVSSKPGLAAKETTIQLQNVALIWVPFVVLGTVLAWCFLRNVPIKANIRDQMDIFRDKHTWFMTMLYIMTFGSFSGYAATFPLLIKETYGKFEGAPDPLTYAYIGPLVGAGIRAIFGPISDKLGGARVTMLSGLGLLACAVAIVPFTTPNSVQQWPGFLWCMLGLFLFSGIGNASTFKQMPMIFQPRQAGGVIGWTSAIAAFGPFVFSVLIGAIIARASSPSAFFVGAAAFYALCLIVNWTFYARPGAAKPC